MFRTVLTWPLWTLWSQKSLEGLEILDPVSIWKQSLQLESSPRSLPLLWKGDLWRSASHPLYVYDRNEVAFSFGSGAEITFLINFVSTSDLCQWVMNPYSNWFYQMSSHLLYCQKIVDFTWLSNWMMQLEAKCDLQKSGFKPDYAVWEKWKKISKENLLFWLKYQITDYLLIHAEQITPSKGSWWWFMSLISKRLYGLRSGWCFLALDSLNTVNIFQSCLKQFMSFNAIFK